MRFDYATRSQDKVEAAKASLTATAHQAGQTIVGFHVFKASDYPPLQVSPHTKGIAHWVVWGFTTQGELDDARTQ